MCQLVAVKINTLVICGCSTCGCVCATTKDATGYDFRINVVREACGDRQSFPYSENLFNNSAKFGIVVAMDEIMKLDIGIS